MKIEELNRILIAFLRDKVSHPDGTTPGNKWIYMDYPRIDTKFPRISISQSTHSTLVAGIGELGFSSKGEWQNTSYDIDIWIKRGNLFTIATKKKAGSALRDYIGDLVLQLLMDWKKWLHDNKDIFDLKIVSTVTIPYMDVNEIFRRTITITITYFRTKQDKS